MMEGEIQVISDSSDENSDSSTDTDIDLSGVHRMQTSPENLGSEQQSVVEPPIVITLSPRAFRNSIPGATNPGANSSQTTVVDLTTPTHSHHNLQEGEGEHRENIPAPTGPSSRFVSGASADLILTSSSESQVSTSNTTAVLAEPQPSSSTYQLNTSAGDFQSPRRYKPQNVVSTEQAHSSGATGSSRVMAQCEEDDEEGQCCPICFEAWTNSGDHRLASLRCGHLFGQSCIEKWLKGQGGKCPQCNNKAKRKDIRVIYAKTLKVTDTSERDRALQALESERQARRTAELQAAEIRLSLQLAKDENRRLIEDLERQRHQLTQYRSNPDRIGNLPDSPTKIQQTQREKFSVEKTVKIWEAGGCRVMACSTFHATLCVSQPSASPLFPGFGIKKLNTLEFRSSQYVALHSKMIRDIAFHPYSNDGLLLSASMDKTVKITSLVANTVVQTYNCPLPAWSCVWDSDSQHHFYVGCQNGTVLLFDLRNTHEHVRVLNEGGNTSPVVSLQYIKHSPNKSFRCGGLVVAQLSQSQFLERNTTEEYKLHLLPLERNITSVCVEDESRHVLATYRPTQTQPKVRHVLYELYHQHDDATTREHTISCNRVQTYHGGGTQKVLARSRLIPDLGNGGMVVAGDEATQCVHVWDITTGLLHQKIPVPGSAVIDFLDLCANNQRHLVALTDKQITVMKWR